MRTHEENHTGGIESESQGKKRTLRFRCPKCGGSEVQELWLLDCHPLQFIEGVEVNPDHLEDDDDVEVLYEGEEEYVDSGHFGGWEYSCKGCGLGLTYEEAGKEQPVENHVQLAQWLLKHCLQSDDDVPVTEEEPEKD